MKITKYVHSCILVETSGRVALFDPGAMSYEAFDLDKLSHLDDILITHVHQDHFHMPFVKDLVAKFPDATIVTTEEVVRQLEVEGIKAQSSVIEGVDFFSAPHENVEPVFPQPEEIGIHYLDVLTNPGDSHSFGETKQILALPITAPWGSAIKALNLTLELKPKFVIPLHDWHWNEDARTQMYDKFEQLLSKEGITMFKPETGQAIDVPIDV
jgi:L-ascorbate metabolism protein UlaG (beta-lactamase superfamily)